MVRGEDIRPIVLYGLPGDEETDFGRQESAKGRVAYVRGKGCAAKEDN
jgi:hypothetical protein